jgi:hypothetical protein
MEQFIQIITGIISCASIICMITKTPKDNAIIHSIYRFVEVLALNIGKAKD